MTRPESTRTTTTDGPAPPARLVPLPLLLLLAACTVTIGGDTPCDATGQRAVELDAAGLEVLKLSAGAGSLTVQGRSGLDRVLVRGEACASEEELLEKVQLEGRRVGDRAVVRSVMPDDIGDGRAEMDLRVEVPSSLAVELDDGSGPTTVRGVAGLTVEDGSGGLTVVGVDGPVEVVDGSGSAEIREVRGDVTVSDGSGSLEVTDIRGSVRIDDGSGGLTIRGVDGSVTVSDGSGGIRVIDITGDLIVEDDGSGNLETERVAGEVIVR